MTDPNLSEHDEFLARVRRTHADVERYVEETIKLRMREADRRADERAKETDVHSGTPLTPDRLRECLDLRRWTQRGLADVLQCDDRLVRRWAAGEAEVPPSVATWLETLGLAHAAAPPPTEWRKRIDLSSVLKRLFPRPASRSSESKAPISQAIAPHLPQLRRFARSLTGSQKSGDAYVVATLEAIVADPREFEDSKDVRCSLYRSLLKLWRPNEASASDTVPTTPNEDIKAGHRALSVLPRVALLLTALEGFDIDEVAVTLDCSVDKARILIEKANSEIASQISTDVLIIEDEPLVALDLQNLVEDLGHKVVDVARTRREALKAAQEHRPGLILADIQLADGSSGLDAVDDILSLYEVPVIFITAYPERLLTGAPPEPTFLIAKPFAIVTLRAVISQVLFFDRKSHRRAS